MGLKIKSSHLPDEIPQSLCYYLKVCRLISEFIIIKHYSLQLSVFRNNVQFFMVVKFGMCVPVCMHVCVCVCVCVVCVCACAIARALRKLVWACARASM